MLDIGFFPWDSHFSPLNFIYFLEKQRFFIPSILCWENKLKYIHLVHVGEAYQNAGGRVGL